MTSSSTLSETHHNKDALLVVESHQARAHEHTITQDKDETTFTTVTNSQDAIHVPLLHTTDMQNQKRSLSSWPPPPTPAPTARPTPEPTQQPRSLASASPLAQNPT